MRGATRQRQLVARVEYLEQVVPQEDDAEFRALLPWLTNDELRRMDELVTAAQEGALTEAEEGDAIMARAVERRTRSEAEGRARGEAEPRPALAAQDNLI